MTTSDANGQAGREFWSVKEFAALLGVGKHVIYRATDRGEIASVKVGGTKLVPNSELERLKSEADERRSA